MRKVRPSRYYNTRIISTKLSYTADEAALLLSIRASTVRTWMREGLLRPIDDRIPYLFHGTALQAACEAINRSFAKPCAEDELFCFGCKKGRVPANRKVRLVPMENGQMKIVGSCEVCGCELHRIVSDATLFKYKRLFTLQPPREDREDSPHTRCQPHSKKESKS